VSQLKRNLLHYAIATITSATTFNQRKRVAKVLLLPFLCLLLHFFGVEFDTKPCSVLAYLYHYSSVFSVLAVYAIVSASPSL
jgi:hypothetical protein